MRREYVNVIRTGILAAFAAIVPAAHSAADAPAPAKALVRMGYNHPGLIVDLGVGLWASPLPMDYNGDGKVDLLVASTGKPDNGIYLFNPASPADAYTFKPGVRVSPAKGNLRTSMRAGQWVLTGNGVWYPKFRQQGLTKGTKFGVTMPVKGTRANQWQFFDYDGDGVDDLVVAVDDWKAYGWDDAFDAQGNWTNGPLHGSVYWAKNLGTNDRPKYGPPQQIFADGKPLDVYGTPSPCLADFDGDGLADLICSEFVDSFTFFKNVGTKTAPKFAAGKPLARDGQAIRMDLCMIVPLAIDFDGDGKVDLLVGQEDGRVALVRNTGKGMDGLPQFEPPRYLRQQADDVKFGVLATPFGVDLNGDGRVDLVCGNSEGQLAFIENLGGKPVRWAALKLLEADGQVVHIQAGLNGSVQGPAERKWGYTVPCVADWDLDGLPDILVNSIWGKIQWYRNVGTKTAPKFAAAEPVEVEWPGPTPKPAWNWWNPQGKELVTQWRSSMAVLDLTGDGLTDLVTLDPQGFLVLYERKKVGDKLVVLPPRRAFHVESGAVSAFDGSHKPVVINPDSSGRNALTRLDESGNLFYVSIDRQAEKRTFRMDKKAPLIGPRDGLETALRLNGGWAGLSGRRKFTFVDWDHDGKVDLIVNSVDATFLKNVSTEPGRIVFRDMGPLAATVLAGHDTCPTVADFDGDGTLQLLVGAEDGYLYRLTDAPPVANATAPAAGEGE